MSASKREPRPTLAALRQLLEDKFPSVEMKPGGFFPTGQPEIDQVEGGLRRAALTELCGSTGGGALLVSALLQAVFRQRAFAALIDGGQSFAAEEFPAALLARLLLIRCATALQAVKATDLLLRDGNLSLLLLDLQRVPAADLRKIPANTWHRFQRLAEQTTAALVVLTREPMVEAAQARITIPARWSLSAQRQRRSTLLKDLPAQVFARRSLKIHPPAEKFSA